MKSSCAPSCRDAVSSGAARCGRAMTLLETVLAMSLLSMIALTGAQAVRMSWQAWDVQDQRSDMLQHLSGVLTHITRLVRSASDRPLNHLISLQRNPVTAKFL